MRIVMVIFGVLLLLPGLCFLGFGGSFAFSGIADLASGLSLIGLIELAVGALVTWGAVLIILNYSRPRRPPPGS